MREVNLDQPSRRTTVMSYGPTRSGKTRWAATWPRPLFLSDATESGWTTIRNMDASAFYETNRRPKIWAIEKPADLLQAIPKIEPLVKSGEVATVVVDSITFYTDLYFSFLVGQQASAGKQPDLRRVYGNMAEHLRYVREQVHNSCAAANVIWLALDKPASEDSPKGGPQIPGQSAQKFAAGCDYILYHRAYRAEKNAPLTYEIRTREYERFVAGGRDEGLLPDPLGFFDKVGDQDVFFADCTYRTFEHVLGLEPWQFAKGAA